MNLNDAGFKYNNNAKSVINGFSTIFEINETSISYSGLVFHAFYDYSVKTVIRLIESFQMIPISLKLTGKNLFKSRSVLCEKVSTWLRHVKNNSDLKISDRNTI